MVEGRALEATIVLTPTDPCVGLHLGVDDLEGYDPGRPMVSCRRSLRGPSGIADNHVQDLRPLGSDSTKTW